MSVQDTRTDSKSDDDARLVAALDEFQLVSKNEAKFDQGEFLSRYPDLADRLKDCLSALGRFDEAIEVFQRLKTDQPKLPNHLHNLAWVYEERARLLIELAKFKEARADLTECLKLWEPLTAEYSGKNPWYPLEIFRQRLDFQEFLTRIDKQNQR